MRQFDVTYTERAERDMRDIFEYIAFTLLEPVIAEKQSNRIIDAIAGLDIMPERFRLYDKEPWRNKGLRVMPVGNYLILYVTSELPSKSKGIVSVIRIIYGGRDIDSELRQTDLTEDLE